MVFKKWHFVPLEDGTLVPKHVAHAPLILHYSSAVGRVQVKCVALQ